VGGDGDVRAGDADCVHQRGQPADGACGMRQQELAVRTALGAGSGARARAAGGERRVGSDGRVLSIAVAYAGLRLLVAIGPADLPRMSEIAIDGSSLDSRCCFRFLRVAFWVDSVLKYARADGFAVLTGTNRTASASRSRNRSRNVLVVAQVAMALVLLVSALLMIRTFARFVTSRQASRMPRTCRL